LSKFEPQIMSIKKCYVFIFDILKLLEEKKLSTKILVMLINVKRVYGKIVLINNKIRIIFLFYNKIV